MKIKRLFTPLFTLTLFLISLQLLYPLIDLLPKATQVIVFIFWLMLIALNQKNLKKNEILFSKTICIYILFFGVLIRIGYSGNFRNGYFDPMGVAIGIYQFIVSYSLFLYIKRLDTFRIKFIVKFSLICILISLLFSLYYVFFVDPQAIRNTQRDFLWGVGDFQLMYTIAILLGSIFSLLKLNQKKLYVYIYIFLIVLTLLKCNLVTSLVIGISSVLIYYLSRFRYKAVAKLLAIIFLVTTIALKEKISNVLIYMSKLDFFYWSTQKKLIAISNLLTGGSNLDTLSSRMRLTMQSLNTFKENPFFGVNYSLYGQGVIGRHAQWADDLARHGLIGIIFILLVGYIVYRDLIISRYNKFDRTNIKNSWFLFIILGFLNPNMMGALLIVMFTVIPFLSCLGETDNYEK